MNEAYRQNKKVTQAPINFIRFLNATVLVKIASNLVGSW